MKIVDMLDSCDMWLW